MLPVTEQHFALLLGKVRNRGTWMLQELPINRSRLGTSSARSAPRCGHSIRPNRAFQTEPLG